MKLFLFLLLPLFSFSQTVVIGVSRADGIYLGADSRITISTDFKYKDETIKDTALYIGCKVFQLGVFNFATAGLYCDKQREFAFKWFNVADSFPKALQSYGDDFLSLLNEHIHQLKKSGIKEYWNFFNAYKNGYVAKTIYALYLDGKPDLGSYTFVLKLAQDSTYFATFNFSSNSEYELGGIIYDIGYTYYNQQIWANGYIEGIRQLMCIERYFHPCEIGEPFDIINITAQGTQWITTKRGCNLISVKCY